MANVLNFATRLIFLKESQCCDKKQQYQDKDKFLMEDEDETITEVPEEVSEEVSEDNSDESTVINDEADEYKESLSDKVYFCANCQKHFIASEDTPENLIVCPICNDDELLVNIGSAEQALDNPENEEISVKIEELEDEEDPDDDQGLEDEDEDNEDDELYLDEESLDECISALARKYMTEAKGYIRAKTHIARIVEGDLILKGTCAGKRYTVKAKDFKKLLGENRKAVIPATIDLFRAGRINMGIIKEGNKLMVKKMGYGLITESVKGKNTKRVKVTGIIG